MSYGYSESDNLRAENSALNKRIECLNSKVYDLETKLNVTKNELLACSEQNNKYYENDARLGTLVDLGKKQLMEKTLSLENIKEELIKVTSERDECREQAKNAYDSISTYTSEIKDLKAGKDDLERHFYHADNSVRSFFQKMHGLLGEGDLSFEKIYEIISSNITKQDKMKDKIDSLIESVETAELESRAARETIQRLASEVTTEQQITIKNKNILNEKNSEVNRLEAECSALAGENRDLLGRLETVKNDKYNLSRILTEKTGLLDEKNAEFGHLKQSFDILSQNFSSFQNEIAEMLYNTATRDDPYNYHKPQSEVGDLLESLRNRLNQIDSLECKIQEMSKDLEYRDAKSCEYFQQTEKHKKTEAQMAADIRHLRDSLASTEIITEGFREGKQNYMKFLEDLINSLKIPSFIEGISTESVALTRAEQLVAMETEALASKSSQIHVLQRKNKAMKEQIDNKDLHNTMLRKKIIQLEEEIKSKSQLQNTRDDQIFRNQKVHKINEKLSDELVQAKKEIQLLKAELCDVSKREKSVHREELNKTQNLEETIGSLRETINRQNFKIDKLKDQKNKREAIINDTNPRIETMETHIEGLTQSLEECREREKQLLDLRETISRLLSLDITSLALPDYEIISRLESLVHSNNIIAKNYVPEEDPYAEAYDLYKPELISVTQKPRTPNKLTKMNRKLNMKIDPTKY